MKHFCEEDTFLRLSSASMPARATFGPQRSRSQQRVIKPPIASAADSCQPAPAAVTPASCAVTTPPPATTIAEDAHRPPADEMWSESSVVEAAESGQCGECVDVVPRLQIAQLLESQSRQQLDPKKGPTKAPRCASCRQPISGPYIKALGKAWHTNHLVCKTCKAPVGKEDLCGQRTLETQPTLSAAVRAAHISFRSQFQSAAAPVSGAG